MYKNDFPVQDESELIHTIALTLLPGIGNVTAKRILAVTGTAEAFFKDATDLTFSRFRSPVTNKTGISQVLNRAEKELNFLEKNGFDVLHFSDIDFPKRLHLCEDGPLVLFLRGNLRLNENRIVSVVGTRKSSRYGEEICEAIIAQLSKYNCTLVSGLAHGIDSCAHRAALSHEIQNIGVLAHGLDRLYPSVNSSLARKMTENGGVITEFLSGTNPDRENFPKRNRIVAGLADAVIVVEAAKSGGALITAELAGSYGREVFAVPGRLNDEFSEGCNRLIRNNRAALLSDPKDLGWYLGWSNKAIKNPVVVQKSLFENFTPQEEKILHLLRNQVNELDLLAIKAGLSVGETSSILLSLEFKGIVNSQPGKRYQLSK